MLNPQHAKICLPFRNTIADCKFLGSGVFSNEHTECLALVSWAYNPSSGEADAEEARVLGQIELISIAQLSQK